MEVSIYMEDEDYYKVFIPDYKSYSRLITNISQSKFLLIKPINIEENYVYINTSKIIDVWIPNEDYDRMMQKEIKEI